jgi:tetratricopeptide (TPR) repeat protein
MFKIRWGLTIITLLMAGGLGVKTVLAQKPQQIQTPKMTVSAYVKQADGLYADGKYKEAIDIYTQALKLFDQSDYVYYNRGNAYRKLKDYKAAIADYTQAIQINPSNTYAYLYRGVAYQANGQSDLAIADYTALIKIDEQNPAPYAKRGEAYLSLKQKTEAIKDLQKAAELYKQLKEPEKAEKILSQLRSLK